MHKDRFTIAEHDGGGFYMKDRGNTMEPMEIEAARLNLMERIACALEAQAAHRVVTVAPRAADLLALADRWDSEADERVERASESGDAKQIDYAVGVAGVLNSKAAILRQAVQS